MISVYYFSIMVAEKSRVTEKGHIQANFSGALETHVLFVGTTMNWEYMCTSCGHPTTMNWEYMCTVCGHPTTNWEYMCTVSHYYELGVHMCTVCGQW